MQNYEQNQVPMADLASRKIQELFIILHAYYTSDELAMLFYPLLGKNMEFKKLVVDYYLHVRVPVNLQNYVDIARECFKRNLKMFSARRFISGCSDRKPNILNTV